MQKVITIDGPSASGKSSVSRELARKLNWQWVSTGAFYRGLGLVALKSQVDTQSEAGLLPLIQSPRWKVELTLPSTLVFFDGEDVTAEIHGEAAGAIASQISQFPGVRQGLLQRQRQLAEDHDGLIAEGRDCGSVVFPQAFMKFYLTANADRRALRRSADDAGSVAETLEMQKKRDFTDSHRKTAPLVAPEGSIVVDSTDLELSSVVELVEGKVREKLGSFSF